jgi:cysteine desulfurase
VTAIYLDHNATTPLEPAVRAEMNAVLDRAVGNASSLHAFGQAARRILDEARARVARLIGALPEEIVFTSGGTEADNLAVLGVVAARSGRPPHVVTSAIEHPAVLNPCRQLELRGCRVTFLAVDREGRLDPAAAIAALSDETALVSVMLANNDVGTLQPVAALAEGARARGVLIHTDAVQAVGKVPVNVHELGVDLLSLSGHKLHGPQGAGALYVRRGTPLEPFMFGGRQERGLRPGTENVAAIAGLGKACELAAMRLAEDGLRMDRLRAAFETAIRERVPGVTVNGGGASRLPNMSHLTFAGLDGETLAISLDLLGLAASVGAACSSGVREPPHVLLAMGRSPAAARSSLRFSFGRGNTDEDVARAVDLVVRAVGVMRSGS